MLAICTDCSWIKWFFLLYGLLGVLLTYEFMRAPMMDDPDDAPPQQK